MTRHRYTGAKLIKSEGKRERVSIRQQCRETRAALVLDARARRLALKEALAAERLALRGTCQTNLATARARVDAAIEEAKRTALDLAKLRLVTRSPAQQHAAERARLRAAENIKESDDEVRRNLSDDLAYVWSKVKHRAGMRGGKRRTRTEAFLEWAEENGATVARILRERGEQLPEEESEAAYVERKKREQLPRNVPGGWTIRADGHDVPLSSKPTLHGAARNVMVARTLARPGRWTRWERSEGGEWHEVRADKTRRDAVGGDGPSRAPLKSRTRAVRERSTRSLAARASRAAARVASVAGVPF